MFAPGRFPKRVVNFRDDQTFLSFFILKIVLDLFGSVKYYEYFRGVKLKTIRYENN